MKIAIFGAGEYGSRAHTYCCQKYGKDCIVCVLDNDPQKHHSYIWDGIEIISPEEFKCDHFNEEFLVIIALNVNYAYSVRKQLNDLGIMNIEVFDTSKWLETGRLISYSDFDTMEDVVLYHVFKEENDVFYIDVGSNDPILHSVTKMLYDMKNASGINIEPQFGFYQTTLLERPRDICINKLCGSSKGINRLYLQDGFSTCELSNVVDESCDSIELETTTLEEICNSYCSNRKISFLKIDVEGFEYEVLKGADFTRYRPQIVIVESTSPSDGRLVQEEWESILLDNDYYFVKMIGVNRWYVAKECNKLSEKILPDSELKKIYNICHVKICS